MLLKIVYSLYTLTSLSELARSIKSLLNAKYPAEQIVISLISKIDQSQAIALQAIGSSTKQGLTDLLHAADAKRDNSFVALRDYVASGLRRENAPYRAACQALWPLFEKNDTTLYRLPFRVETQSIESLLTDLKAGDAPVHLATINATEWVEELDSNNQAFVDVQLQRASAKTTDTTVTDDEAFKHLTVSLELVNSTMDSLAMMEVAGVEAVAAELNTYISDANTNARIIKSKPAVDPTAN